MESDINKPFPPNNYLALSIVVTIFCCLPFGIVGIVKASQVDSFYRSGFYEEAQRASDDAKKWVIIAAVSGAVFIIGYLMLIVLGVALSN